MRSTPLRAPDDICRAESGTGEVITSLEFIGTKI